MDVLNEEEIIKIYSGNYTIDELSEMLSKGFLFNDFYYDMFSLKEKIINLETNIYRQFINKLSLNNLDLANNIENDRFEYVKKIIESIDNNSIFSSLYNKGVEELEKILPTNSLKKVKYELSKGNSIEFLLKSYTIKCFYEYVIDLYFKDITFNVIHNLKTMLTYLTKINENIIPLERLNFYKNILNFYNLNLDEQKQLFYMYDKNVSYIDNFYADFLKCKMHSYNNINNSIITKDNLDQLFNKDLSDLYKTKIYELNGEDFFLYVHVSRINDKLEFPYNRNNDRKTLSLSLIGSDNITTYKPRRDYVILGFDYLDPNKIMHLANSDSYSSSLNSTNKFQRIYEPSDLLRRTFGYNEILYKKRDKDELWPTCIICFDEIGDTDLYYSKKEGLPIIKINSLKYKKGGAIEDRIESIYIDEIKAKEIESYNIYV